MSDFDRDELVRLSLHAQALKMYLSCKIAVRDRLLDEICQKVAILWPEGRSVKEHADALTKETLDLNLAHLADENNALASSLKQILDENARELESENEET